MSDPCVDALKTARIRMLMNYPFFGIISQRLKYIENNDWCDTAAVDGKNMYWNREFIKSLSDDEILFLICHEILHMVYDHLGRTGHRDKELANMAQDYLINYVLQMEGVGTMPQIGLYDKQYNNSMTSEEIYDILVKKGVPKQKTLDLHLDMSGKDGQPGMTKDELEVLKQELKGVIVQASQAAKMAGKMPAGIQRLIDDLVEPKVPWQKYVNKTIKALYKENYTYLKQSRRMLGQPKGSKIVLPGRKPGKTADIAVAFDMSGSIGQEEARFFLSEVLGMMGILKKFRLTLFTFDTGIYNPQVFTEHDRHKVLEYDFQGGGGSDFTEAWEFMKNPSSKGFGYIKPFEPEQNLIIFSDLYLNGFGQQICKNTVWVCVGNKSQEAPYGKTIYADDFQGE